MPKTLRNQFDKYLTYEKIMEAHNKAKKGKGFRKELILFNVKQEEYIMWIYEQLKTKQYKHGGYTIFYVTEPKLRKIEKSRYIDRIVHRWLVDNFLGPAFVPQFINTSFACLKDKGMHKACIYVQNTMKHCKRIWQEYYILKMDIAKYFDNIDKEILLKILKSIVKIKGYNNIADWCYKELKKGNSILIEGYLNKKMEVIILSVCHWGRSLLTTLLIKVHYILYYKQFVPNLD